MANQKRQREEERQTYAALIIHLTPYGPNIYVVKNKLLDEERDVLRRLQATSDSCYPHKDSIDPLTRYAYDVFKMMMDDDEHECENPKYAGQAPDDAKTYEKKLHALHQLRHHKNSFGDRIESFEFGDEQIQQHLVRTQVPTYFFFTDES